MVERKKAFPSEHEAEELSFAQPLEQEEAGVKRLFIQQELSDQEFATNRLDALLNAHWTLDTVLDALRIALQGIQGLPIHLQQTLLLGMLSRMDILALSGSKRVSAEERRQVK